MMLVHRKIDEIKRKGPWISKLRDVAKFTVSTTSADHFSSAKGAAHSEEMKKRALEQILPSIFEVAQAYEDHIMQYNLIEGSGNKDPGRGRHHTWKPIPRPIRRQQTKRPRRTTGPERMQETVYEASGDETESDDAMIRLAGIPRSLPHVFSTPPPVIAPAIPMVSTPSASGPCTPATVQDDCMMHRTASTPNSSFDQSLHGLHLGEEDLDMKPHVRTMSDHGGMQPAYNMPSYTQPMQYPSYPPADNYANQACAYSQNGPTFVNPFSVFGATTPVMGYGQFASPMSTAHGYSYEQGIFPPTPMSYPNTPMNMPMTPSDSGVTFHGLPADYSVDAQGVHRF